MKLQKLSTRLACLGMAAILATPALSQDKPEAQGQDSAGGQMNAEMQAWMKAATPNENHKRLEYMLGKWDCSVTIWEPGMDAPMESQGKGKNRWILGERYISMHFKGSFFGMPFEGRGLTGYDNINKRYFSSWSDTMSTGITVDYGQYDEATDTFVYRGEFKSPLGKLEKTKTVIKVVSKDQHIMTMYMVPDEGAQIKHMEITYNRDKSSASATPGVAKPAGAGRVKLVETGCGKCMYKLDGVTSCSLAVKIDGKAYLVSGADVDARSAGLCGASKQAEVAGKIVDGKYIASSFKLKP